MSVNTGRHHRALGVDRLFVVGKGCDLELPAPLADIPEPAMHCGGNL